MKLRSGMRITLSPNDSTSTPRIVRGVLAYWTGENGSYFLMLGGAAKAVEFPAFAWHIVEPIVVSPVGIHAEA